MAFFTHSFRDMPFKDVMAVGRDHLAKIALLDVEPFEEEGRLHSIGMDVRVLPGLSAARLWCSPARATRTAAHAADGNDNIVLVMPVDTDMAISHPGREETVCRAGEAYIWAGDEPASFAYHADCQTLNISLPRAALASFIGSPDARLMSKLDPARASDLWLLTSYTSTLVQNETLSPEAAQLAASHVHHLAALLLGPDRDMAGIAAQPGVRAARLAAIKADIAASITTPLTAEAICLRHGISPRYLRALFADEGTSFTDFVLGQRLALAWRMLGDPGQAGRTVAEIAYGAGFNDLSYFNRAFRRRYRMTPSDTRVAQLPQGGG